MCRLTVTVLAVLSFLAFANPVNAQYDIPYGNDAAPAAEQEPAAEDASGEAASSEDEPDDSIRQYGSLKNICMPDGRYGFMIMLNNGIQVTIPKPFDQIAKDQGSTSFKGTDDCLGNGCGTIMMCPNPNACRLVTGGITIESIDEKDDVTGYIDLDDSEERNIFFVNYLRNKETCY